MLSGHVLDLYYIFYTYTVLFGKKYTKLYFDAKHLEKKMNREGGVGGEGIFGALFLKKCPFYMKKVPFLHQKGALFLKENALSGQY